MQQQWQKVPGAPDEKPPHNNITAALLTVPLSLLFFFSSACVLFGGILGTFYYFFNMFSITPRPYDFLAEVYLLLFGTLMCLLDAPLQFKFLMKMKIGIGKYARILTRLTGKGLWFLFLGSATFATLLERLKEPWAATILGGPVALLGLYSLTLGILKSLKWDRVRCKIISMGSGFREELIGRHKVSSPHGLTRTEFWNLAVDASGLNFDHVEVSLAFNALTSENAPATDSSSQLITDDNLIEWTQEGPLVLL